MTLAAVLSTAKSGINIYFRVFDADDPYTNDPPIDSNDYHGEDNRGQVSLNTLSAATDSQGLAQVTFTVSMQPGDNYRCIASTKAGYVESIAQEDVDLEMWKVEGWLPAHAKVSSMLTVWRRLWYEFDSMGPPKLSGSHDETNFEEHIVRAITPNLPITGKSTVGIYGLLVDSANRYENGHIRFPDGSVYTIISNTDNWLWDDDIVVDGIVPQSYNGQKIKIYDDDWVIPSSPATGPEVLKRPMPYAISAGPLFDGPYSAFAPAYIFPVSVPAEYIDTNIPFSRLMDAVHIDTSYKAFSSSQLFWYAYVLAAWECENNADCDPDNEDSTKGISIFDSDKACVFVEVLRELDQKGGPGRERLTEEHTIVHEIGHTGGVWRPGPQRHTDDGSIMDSDAPCLTNWPFYNKFDNGCLDVFRSRIIF